MYPTRSELNKRWLQDIAPVRQRSKVKRIGPCEVCKEIKLLIAFGICRRCYDRKRDEVIGG